jgi:predicted small metal-binding protein
MEKVLQCDCGFEARAEHEHGLVVEVRRHAWEAHGMVLSLDEALLLAFRAALDATGSSHKPIGEALHDPSQDDMSDQKEEQ